MRIARGKLGRSVQELVMMMATSGEGNVFVNCIVQLGNLLTNDRRGDMRMELGELCHLCK